MEDEDEQIRRAIELSLQTSAASQGGAEDEKALDEDEELARAIQLSLASESLISGQSLRGGKSTPSVPASSRASDDDVCKRGTLFVLNEIKGMKGADANAGCITIRKLVQPVRPSTFSHLCPISSPDPSFPLSSQRTRWWRHW
jgi:hypothetical protein